MSKNRLDSEWGMQKGLEGIESKGWMDPDYPISPPHLAGGSLRLNARQRERERESGAQVAVPCHSPWEQVAKSREMPPSLSGVPVSSGMKRNTQM